MKKLVMLFIVALSLAFITTPEVVSAYDDYLGVIPDVYSDKSYAKPVYWASNHSYIDCYDEGLFGPEDGCDRLTFVNALWNIAGCPQTDYKNDFTDTMVCASAPINWAVDEDIIRGYKDGTFRPFEIVTRQQVAVMLWRWQNRPQAKGQVPFTDITETSSAFSAIQWGVEQGIIKGFKDNTYRPTNVCTRGQIATFLYRYARECCGKNVNDVYVPFNERAYSLITLPDITEEWIRSRFDHELSATEYVLNYGYIMQIKNVLAQIGIVDGMKDYEAFDLILNWMCDNTEYDYSYLNYDWNDILDWNYGVCNSYATLMTLMCQMSGIDCQYVHGYSSEEYHAWNYVKIADNWYWIDATFYDASERCSYYLNADLWANHQVIGTSYVVSLASPNTWKDVDNFTENQRKMLDLSNNYHCINELVTDDVIEITQYDDAWNFTPVENCYSYRVFYLDENEDVLISIDISIKNTEMRCYLVPPEIAKDAASIAVFAKML